MTQSPFWPAEAAELDPAIDADIGLHLTLSDQVATSSSALAPDGRLPPLRRLWTMLLTNDAARRAARDELHRQLDNFVRRMGRPPDFIDGHQHVHLMPFVRRAVIEVAAEIGRERPVYVRVCADPWHRIVARGVAVPKALFLATLSRPLRRLADAMAVPTNDSFRGVSNFDGAQPFGHEFRRFLVGPGLRPLVMCHPGHLDHHLATLDSLVEQRQREFEYLATDEVTRDLFHAGMKIARFRETSGPGSENALQTAGMGRA